jgi:hypothetical protein
MRPFVVEHLISTVLAQHNFFVKIVAYAYAYAYSAQDYRAEFGVQLGNLLHALSKLKNAVWERRDVESLKAWNRLRHAVLRDKYVSLPRHFGDPSAFYLTPAFAFLALLGESVSDQLG